MRILIRIFCFVFLNCLFVAANAGVPFTAHVPRGDHSLPYSSTVKTPSNGENDAGISRNGNFISKYSFGVPDFASAGSLTGDDEILMPDNGKRRLRSSDAHPVFFKGLLKAANLESAEVTVVYNSDSDIPITSNGYTASGNTVKFTLNHTPTTGVELMVVNNTSRNFINGAFSNLPQGQLVKLSQGGLVHSFVANYYGGTGNDLVLVWAETRVVSWGANSNGELGDGSESDRRAAVLVSDAASASALFGKTVLSISSGGGHSLALCSDGSIAAWGSNSSGQLGNNNSSGPSYLPITVSTDQSSSYLSGKSVVAVSAGQSHSLALCSDGTVAAWGSNYNGAVGDGSAESRSSPVAVYAADNDSALFGKTVVAISAGNGHSLA
ncbi:MAG: hypothetical protein EOP86_14340, partial [Verrucomicrobiaceae bacterium]